MTVKLGIIGYGGMGEWHHRNTTGIKDLKILAAYDIDAERVALAKKNALELKRDSEFTGFDSLSSILKDNRLNTVLVATPNDTHKDLCLAAIHAGKNVICEKPATLSVQELDEIIAAAKEKKVLFTVHQNRRWDQDYQKVKKSIEQGYLGKVFSIDTKLHGGGGIIHGWRAQKEHGGGMILDWGVHIIDQILDMIPNKIKTVYCQTLSILNPGVDDFFKLLITFEGGVVAQVEVGTFCLRGSFRTWHTCGDKGGLTLTLDYQGLSGGITRVRQFNNKWESKIIETYAGPTRTFAPLSPDQVEELSLPEVNPNWNEFYENVDVAIAGKSELIIKPYQVRRVIKVMDACFKSSETGAAVIFDE